MRRILQACAQALPKVRGASQNPSHLQAASTPLFFQRTGGILYNLYYVLVGWPVTGRCAEAVAKGGCLSFLYRGA